MHVRCTHLWVGEMLQCCFHLGVDLHVGTSVYHEWWLPWLFQRCRVAASQLAVCQWDMLSGLGCVVVLSLADEHLIMRYFKTFGNDAPSGVLAPVVQSADRQGPCAHRKAFLLQCAPCATWRTSHILPCISRVVRLEVLRSLVCNMKLLNWERQSSLSAMGIWRMAIS